ncbi:MAG TPA: radical SAM protein [Longimicrobiaceae bacterium]|nr:radical SAM protein [Longimicrobiaceae bacterium]
MAATATAGTRAQDARDEQATLFADPRFSAPGRPPLPVLQQRGDTAFYELAGSRIATPGTGVMRGWLTVNPYVGCEMSCSYCYAPYAHGWLVDRLQAEGRIPEGPGLPLAFDRGIFVKAAAESVTRAVARSPGWSLALGTATDPYQPAERRFRLTRGVLEELARLRGVTLSITTKSPLVLRDLDLLERIAARSRLTVHLSLISTDRVLLRRIEPRSPTPERRLAALRALRQRGIRAGIFAMPLLPGLTDGAEAIDALFAAAREADACFVVAGGVRLSGVSWKRFLPVLRELRPDLVDAYRTVVRDRRSPKREAYRRRLDERIRGARERHGFTGPVPWEYGASPEPEPQQLALL